jgi:hypothetical protein
VLAQPNNVCLVSLSLKHVVIDEVVSIHVLLELVQFLFRTLAPDLSVLKKTCRNKSHFCKLFLDDSKISVKNGFSNLFLCLYYFLDFPELLRKKSSH